jgi:hypothetical protein
MNIESCLVDKSSLVIQIFSVVLRKDAVASRYHIRTELFILRSE